MLYKTHYESPLGDLLLTADAQALTGVWFDGRIWSLKRAQRFAMRPARKNMHRCWLM